jgi:hypothetical protein
LSEPFGSNDLRVLSKYEQAPQGAWTTMPQADKDSYLRIHTRPDAAKCDPQNWPTEKNRQKVPPFGVGTRLSALSRQNRHHLVAQFCASSALFRECLERAEKPATGWLCWQSAANSSPLVKFPDLRENTGKFRSSRLSARSRSPVNPGNSIAKSRFPCTVEQGIVQTEQGTLRSGTSPAGTRQVPQVLRRLRLAPLRTSASRMGRAVLVLTARQIERMHHAMK